MDKKSEMYVLITINRYNHFSIRPWLALSKTKLNLV